MDNLKEMNKFLEKYNLPKLNQEETEEKSNKFPNSTPKATRKGRNEAPQG